MSGYGRFDFFLKRVESLLLTAVGTTDPALWLYENDARTSLFMLEALSRLYAEQNNSKKFTKLKEQFKLLEDFLGAIDHYDHYAKRYASSPKVPESVQSYMRHHADVMLEKFNQILIEEGWIGNGSHRIQKIKKTLQGINWDSEKKQVKSLKKLYAKSIDSIKDFVIEHGNPFEDMELHVHEVRRDLRWLSIFPHALMGQIQLVPNSISASLTEKYMTSEVLSSKFNVFPEYGDNESVLMLDKNCFFALSWMISEIGRLKDEGLEFFALKDALKDAEHMNDLDASIKAFEILNWESTKVNEILIYASQICKEFVNSGILDLLLFGMAEIKKFR
ncbi:MAG: hypothetical protein O9264_18880 [Leptospira sp.]|nr:hypothetical protein [Leptospira sp.]